MAHRLRVSRRDVLGLTAGSIAGLGGCSGVLGRGGAAPVSVLAAGSLQLALVEGLQATVDQPLEIEAHGSVTVARMIAEGQQDPDVVAVADPILFESILSVPWYAEYATNALVVAYNPEVDGGQRIARADRWYDPLVSGAARLGRSDPELDPLGYRTLFALELASDYYGRPELAEDILRSDQIYPETELISHFETGSLDAAVVYRNMAVERGYEFIALPNEIDLSSPAHVDDWYSRASFDLSNGQKVRGGLVSYTATIHDGHHSDATRGVFDALIRGDYLREHGFDVPTSYPRFTGHVPDDITQ